MLERQKRFAVHYAETGNGAEAARRAGYAESSARQTAYKLKQKESVKHAVEREQWFENHCSRSTACFTESMGSESLIHDPIDLPASSKKACPMSKASALGMGEWFSILQVTSTVWSHGSTMTIAWSISGSSVPMRNTTKLMYKLFNRRRKKLWTSNRLKLMPTTKRH